MKYTSVPKKSVERKCKWAIWTILRKKYHLCVKNRAIIVAKAVVWLPWYFWENMWLWCSSRLFPPIYRPCWKKMRDFLHLDIISCLIHDLTQLEKRLGARKLCGHPNLIFWEVWPISGSNEWSKQTIYSFLQIFVSLTCKNGLVIPMIFRAKILVMWSKFVGYFLC